MAPSSRRSTSSRIPELREALKRYSNWPTYPQLYVNGELIGGADIIQEMHRSGELKQLVEDTRAA